MQSKTFQKLTPYRVVVFGQNKNQKSRKRGVKILGFAYDAWNPVLTEHYAHAGRLEGSGSFCWLGLRDAKNAVGRAFLEPHITQVQIRDNQDRKIAIFYRGLTESTAKLKIKAMHMSKAA